MIEEIPFPVTPRSWKEIDAITAKYLLDNQPTALERPCKVDVVRLLEVSAALTHDLEIDYTGEVLPPFEALLDPMKGSLAFSRATLDGLVMGRPRARFTGAHELGHVLLHMAYIRENRLKLARSGPVLVDAYMRPEPQANHAAGCILLPRKTFVPEYLRLQKKGWQDWEIDDDLRNTFGVSEDTLTIRVKWLKKEGLL